MYSCDFVPCGEAWEGIVVAEGILEWKMWTCEANQGQGACRGKGLAVKPDPLSHLGK